MDCEKQGECNYNNLILTKDNFFDTIIIVRKQFPPNSRPEEFLMIIKIVNPLILLG